jgi:DNA repair protein RecO
MPRPATEHSAIVLHLTSYGEADRVVTLLVRDRGRVLAIARGARRGGRRFGGGLSVFCMGLASLRDGRGELATLERFDARSLHVGLAIDPIRLAHASYMVELVRELLPPELAEPRAYDVLLDGLQSLAAWGACPAVLRAYELTLLQTLGAAPTLDRCIVCGHALPQDRSAFERAAAAGGPTAGEAADGSAVHDEPAVGPAVPFDVVRGGPLCERCLRRDGGSVAPDPLRRWLSWELRTWLSRVGSDESPIAAARRLPIAPAENRVCRELLASLLGAQRGRPLRSVDFLHKLTRRSGAVPGPTPSSGSDV